MADDEDAGSRSAKSGLERRWQRVVQEASLPSQYRTPGTALERGVRLGRWTLVRRIAKGGMATIWVAWRRRSQGGREVVAVKIILAHLAVDRAFVRMFLDEARLLTNIHHPNVVRIRDLGIQDHLPYVAIEWIDGDTLAALQKSLQTKGAELPLRIVLRIVASCASGLHAAHELTDEEGQFLDVVHRDVSPPNILVSSKGHVKLIDFGVAKAADRLAEQTRTGVIKGKIAYMSPEQAANRRVDRRADIWSLGVVCYELLSKRGPFEGGLVDIFAKIKSGAPIDPLPKTVPPPIAEVVDRALQADPVQRYRTAEELHDAVIESAGRAGMSVATTSELAAFVQEHLSESLAERQAEVNDALTAPDEDPPD